MNQLFLSAISANTGDALKTFYEHSLDWVWGMAPASFWFPIRALLALGVSTTLCAFTFYRLQCRLAPVQWAFCMFGFLLAMEVPITLLPLGRTMKGWLFGFSLLGAVTLPWALAWFLVNKSGWRKVIACTIYVALFVLFIINLLEA